MPSSKEAASARVSGSPIPEVEVIPDADKFATDWLAQCSVLFPAENTSNGTSDRESSSSKITLASAQVMVLSGWKTGAPVSFLLP